MRIISRSEWGFSGWRNAPKPRPLSTWTHFVVHYEGETPCGRQIGPSVPRGIHAFHKNGRRWSGIGYNFVVDQAGNVYEGRGWNMQGAHKPSGPGSNAHGIGVQCHIGGREEPSDAMKRAVADLYDEACRRTGRRLVKSWHNQGYATSCPGPHLIAWVKAGMPRPGGSSPAPSGAASAGKHRPPATACAAPPWPLPSTHRIGPNPHRRTTWHDGLGGDRAGHAAIEALQRRLSERGWAIGIDGRFGGESARVVSAFQREKGITADAAGTVGPTTWAAAWAAPVTK